MSNRTTSYLVKLTPDEKSDLQTRAKARGMSLADAFRQGADQLLAENHSNDPLANEVYALARKIDRRLK